ncbi:hypothetical protein [Mesorhizobium sp.]|uniref:hypothetical protein n=1 Tax=Mesorhizobium sp. TaxID=1871066 RepID=UPI000FE86AC8|nr:hypothetical protein [Mesorhizobium sp.]RWM78449.1 MAG: transposase [Mesorhizobium sp.]TIL70969.1 MAG: transposase [Mesorhizobium sp.]
MYQRTELVNALRAHLYEFGYVAPQGIGHLRRLAEIVEDESAELPDLVRDICSALLDQIDELSSRLAALKKTMDTLSKQTATSRHLQTMPGVGPIAALVIEIFAPPMGPAGNGRKSNSITCPMLQVLLCEHLASTQELDAHDCPTGRSARLVKRARYPPHKIRIGIGSGE